MTYTAALTIGGILCLIGIIIVKIWNISKYEKGLNMWITLGSFGLSWLAMGALMISLSTTIHMAAADELYNSDVLQASLVFRGGTGLFMLSFLLTVVEVMVFLGVITLSWLNPNMRRQR